MKSLRARRGFLFTSLFDAGRIVRTLCGLAALAGTCAHAQTWNGGSASDSNWTTSSNWSGGVPANNGTANLVFSGSVRPLPLADANWSLRSITFGAGAAGFVIDGNLLTIGAGGITNNGANLQTIENQIALSSAQTWNAASGALLFQGATANGGYWLTAAGANDVTIEGAISGTGGIVKTGAGTLTLGSSASTYGGGTELHAGVVSVSENAALGTAAGSLVFEGGTLEITGTSFSSTARAISWSTGGGGFRIADAGHTFTVSQSLGGSGVLHKSGAGTLILSGSNSYSGQTTISAGVLRLAGGSAISDSGAVSLGNASGVALDLNGTSETVGSISGGGASGGNITLGAGTLTVAGGNFAGVISGAGGSLAVKTNVLELAGANTFTGGTTISDGGSVWLNPGGTLGTGAITITGGGAYDDIANGLFFARSDTLGSAASTPAQAISVSTAGFITSLETFTTLGAVTLNAGIIETDGGASAGHQAFFLRGTVTVEASAASSYIRPYAGSPGAVNGGVHLRSSAGDGTTFDVADGSAANDLIVNAILIDPPSEDAGAGSLIKTGAGNMKIGSASTFTGATLVNAGTLEIGGSGSLGATSQITVQSGGTLLLSGDPATNKIGNTTAVTLDGGKFNAGGLDGLDEQMGVLTLSSTSTLDFGAASTSETLRFAASSGVTWTGALHVWNWNAGVDHLFVGTDSTGLNSSQLAQVSFYSDSGSTLLPGITAFAGAGELTLVPIPEASTFVAAAGLLGLIGARRRRRIAGRCLVLGMLLGSLSVDGLAHGDVDLAIVAVTQQIAAQPADAQLYLRRGGLHREHQDWIAADADFKKALALDPQLIIAELRRGEMLCEAGRHAHAKEPLDRFLAQYPHDSDGRAARARVHVSAEQWAAAEEDFVQAIAFAPAPDPTLYIERAAALRAAGRLDAAIRAIEEGIARLGPLTTLVQPAIDYEVEAGRLDAALTRLGKVIDAAPRKERWLLRRGELLEKAGQPAAARAAYADAQAALERVPATRRAAPATQDMEREIAGALARVTQAP